MNMFDRKHLCAEGGALTGLPRVFLGDHGFLRQYGSTLQDAEIVYRMRLALRCGIRGLSAGDARVAAAVIEAFGLEGMAPVWARHFDLPLAHSCETFSFDRAMAFLRLKIVKTFGSPALADPIMGPFLTRFEQTSPYQEEDLSRLDLDHDLVAHVDCEIRSRRPAILTIGGDVLDFLLAAGRADLIEHCIRILAPVCNSTGCRVFLATYAGLMRLDHLLSLAAGGDIAGLMLCVNTAGAGMIPDKHRLLAVAARLNKPIAAMHVLNLGKIPVSDALAPIVTRPGISLAFVGASKVQHIVALAQAVRALETA